jgi:hypothetical protein
MRYFPHLGTGSVAQYPLIKKTTHHNIVNDTVDGHRIKAPSLMTTVEWSLTYVGLTSNEASLLKAFFEECEGRLNSFVFADPIDNLLARSEDLTDVVWNRDPLIQAQSGVLDPLGTTRAYRLTNLGQAQQGIRQVVSSSAAYNYCFSLYARSNIPSFIRLRSSAFPASHEKTFECNSNWRRLNMTSSLGIEQGPVLFELVLGAGSVVEVFGFQVDAQVEPSAYKTTTNRGGVYDDARFNSDSIALSADGAEQFSTQLTILSRLGG